MNMRQLTLLNEEIPLNFILPSIGMLAGVEQPAFRLVKDADACSLLELVAVLIGGPVQLESAARLLAEFGSIHKLAQAHIDEIARIRGIGVPAARRLKAAIAIGRKLLQPEETRPTIHSPADAAQILMPLLAHRAQEYLIVMALDTRNHLLEATEIYHGTLNSSSVRVGELFKPALQRNAASILIAHNHPSMDPTPSPEDVSVTRAVVQAGKLLDVEVMDHLVIGLSKWTSLRERGLGFS